MTFSTIFLSQSGSVSSSNFYLFFLSKYSMSVVPVKYLHFRFRQKWNVDFTNGWNQGRPGSYLVNKLEIEESSDLAFSPLSFSSFLAGYNCLQQLYINRAKTNNQFSNLVCFSYRLTKGRPGSSLAYQTKRALSSDKAV